MIDFDPEKRPTMREVYFTLKNILNNVWNTEEKLSEF